VYKRQPYIEAVFGSAEGEKRFPFTIADRNIKNESRIADLFLEILELPGSRMEVSRVQAILESGPVRERFGFSEGDIEIINRWMEETGIRWGINGDYKSELGLPPFEENTWLAGIKRMLLGYAMSGDGYEFFNDVLPFDQIEGNVTIILGRFLSFIEVLISVIDETKISRSLNDWSEFFQEIVESFFPDTPETEHDLEYLRGQIRTLSGIEAVSRYDKVISFSILKYFFRERFNNEMTGRGFIKGGVTFCSMVPLRSIPFKIICILGMNDDLYPRKSVPPGFDLMSLEILPGDRNIRESDRYLFLETLLSARESLYLSYNGRSIRDNSELLPSSVLIELLDYVKKGFSSHDEDNAEKLVLVEHPLQPFSMKYFRGKDRELFSYQRKNLDVARNITAQRETVKSFYTGRIKLTEDDEDLKVISAEKLVEFLRNPVKYFLNRRLGIDLGFFSPQAEDSENFDLDGLMNYNISSEMLDRYLEGESLENVENVYRARGIIPHGSIGSIHMENISLSMNNFGQMVKDEIGGAKVEHLSFSAVIDDITINVHNLKLYDNNLILFRPSSLKAVDRIKLWVYHLLVNAHGIGSESRFISSDRRLLLKPLSDAGSVLSEILDLYREGLERCIPFFPQSSWEYVQGLYDEKNPGEVTALKKFRSKWEDNHMFEGEMNRDPYIKLCFENVSVPEMHEDLKNKAFLIYNDLLSNSVEEDIDE